MSLDTIVMLASLLGVAVALFGAIGAALRNLREDLRAEIRAVARASEQRDTALRDEIGGLRGEMRELDARLSGEIRELRVELHADVQRVDDRVMFLMTRLIPEPAASGWPPPQAATP